jgi:hypothetical protein
MLGHLAQGGGQSFQGHLEHAGNLETPVSLPISSSIMPLAFLRASVTAASTRSCSISTSPASTTLLSIVTESTCWPPVARTMTMPPPALPSTSRVLSSSCKAVIFFCIIWAWRSISCIPRMSSSGLVLDCADAKMASKMSS